MELLTEIGYPDHKEVLFKVNPHLFSKMKYLTRIEPDEMLENTADSRRVMAEKMYATFRNDPLVEPEFTVRKLLNVYVGNEVEDAIRKQPSAQEIERIMGGAEVPVPTPTA